MQVMWLSAVKPLVLLLAHGTQQLTPEDQTTYRMIESRLVYLVQAGQPSGTGSMIDDDGLVIIHRSAVYGPNLIGRLANGSSVSLRLLSTDEPTQISLLQAADWKRDRVPSSRGSETSKRTAGPVRATVQKPEGFALAVLPNGTPMRAELVSSSRIGIVNPARRVMSLAEFRFEAPPQAVGGSLLFNQEGKLIGILGATLDGPALGLIGQNQNFGAGGGGNFTGLQQKAVGPAQLTVGYSVSVDVLDRVIEGFRSPSHEVEHPAIGIFCRDAGADRGAQVDSVLVGSPASKAGLKGGDIITELDGKPVTNQIDYARAMLKQRVGAVIKVKVLRQGLEQVLTVTVGK